MNNQEIRITFPANRVMREKIKDIAENHGISMAALIRNVMYDFVSMRDAEKQKPIIPIRKK
jgi:hypothetical protein